jgi:antirestriction protein ArdC
MKVEQIITDKIIEYLKKGEIPWKKPWISQLPKNLITKREYSGINVFLLAMLEYKSPWFLTFKQVTGLKGKVKKGEHGCAITYWGVYEPEKNKKDRYEDEINAVPFMRYYTVFNTEQCEGIEVPEEYKHKRNSNKEEVLKTYKNRPEIKFGGDRACFKPKEDIISMPPLNSFKQVDGYYGTLYHELIHSTGVESRLNRYGTDSNGMFGSESYSKEELVAELGSAFLCARYNINNSELTNSVAYIQGWLKPLQNDPKFVISASSKAQKAVNYMLGKVDENRE